MQQHPIPQDIIAYKFRLVGSMTLKQFLELAAGLVTAWITFNSSANFFIKWTLGPFAAFLGFALAFVPFKDRPLDQWIINFIKAIYNPTQFLYQRQPKTLAIFSPAKPKPPKTKTTIRQPGELEEYLKSLPPSPTTAFDQAEQKYLEHIHNLFGALGTKPPPPVKETLQPSTPLQSPIKGVRVRKLMTPQMCLLPHATLYQSPSQPQVAAIPHTLPQPTPPPPTTKPQPVTTAKPKPPAPKPAAKTTQPPPRPSPPVTPPPPAAAKPATFAPDIILPQKPDKPNLIAGITLDKAAKIVPNVILEVKNHKGHPVRAFKSNKLGQFFIATPLKEGIYQISAEHPDHRFAIIKLEAKGEIIPPLKIQAL